MKSRKQGCRSRTASARDAAARRAVIDPRSRAYADRYEVEVARPDGDAVPAPLEEWGDADDDATRWLDEHRGLGEESYEA
ncbi:MAG: hypothetical protein ACXW2I_06455 [Burkholderiales bacterium]